MSWFEYSDMFDIAQIKKSNKINYDRAKSKNSIENATIFKMPKSFQLQFHFFGFSRATLDCI